MKANKYKKYKTAGYVIPLLVLLLFNMSAMAQTPIEYRATTESDGAVMMNSDSRFIYTILDKGDEVEIQVMVSGIISTQACRTLFQYDTTKVWPIEGPGGNPINTNLFNLDTDEDPSYLKFSSLNPMVLSLNGMIARGELHVDSGIVRQVTTCVHEDNPTLDTCFHNTSSNIMVLNTFYFKKKTEIDNQTFAFYSVLEETPGSPKTATSIWYIQSHVAQNSIGDGRPDHFVKPELFWWRTPSQVFTDTVKLAEVKHNRAVLNGSMKSGSLTQSSVLDCDSIRRYGFIYTQENVNLSTLPYTDSLVVDGKNYPFPDETEIASQNFIRDGKQFFITSDENAIKPIDKPYSKEVANLENKTDYYYWAFMEYNFQTSSKYPVVGERELFVTPLGELTLELEEAVNTDSVCSGSDVSFALKIKNIGEEKYTDIVVKNEFSQGLAFLSANPGSEYNQTSGIWKIRELEAGDSTTIEFTLNTGSIGGQQVSHTLLIDSVNGEGVDEINQIQKTTQTWVLPKPVANELADVFVCTGATAPIALNGNNVNSFTWKGGDSIGLAAGNGMRIPSFIAKNKTSQKRSATITVSPYYTTSQSSCKGDSVSFDIVVNPVPTVDIPMELVYCHGEDVPAYFFSGSTHTDSTEYRWERINGHGFGIPVTSGTDSIPAFTANNIGQQYLEADYKVTPYFIDGSGNECAGTAGTFRITVNPVPALSPVKDKVFFNNTQTTAFDFGSEVPNPNVTYKWRCISDKNLINVPDTGKGSFPSFLPENKTLEPVTAQYEVKVTYEYANRICGNATDTFNITVDPTPSIAAIADQTYCTDEITQQIVFGNVTNTQYRWKQTGGEKITDETLDLFAGGNDTLPSFQTINNTNQVKIARFEVTPWTKDGLSSGDPATFTISVKPKANLTSLADAGEICSGSTFSYTATSDVIGVTYNWKRQAIASINNGVAANGRTSGINEILVNNSDETVPVTYQFVLANGLCTDTFDVVVNVKPVPVLTPVATTIYTCPADSAVFEYRSSQDMAEVSYTITFPVESLRAGFKNLSGTLNLVSNGQSQALKIPLPVPAPAAGYYPAELTIESNGCQSGNKYAFGIQVMKTTKIVAQPVSTMEACEGGSFSLSVNAEGENLQYQWYQNGEAIAGATESVYTVETVAGSENLGNYWVEVSGACGEKLISQTTTVTTGIPILSKWTNSALPVLFVDNSKKLYTAYQWYFNGTAIGVDNTAQYYPVSGSQNGSYQVQVFYADGTSKMSCPFEFASDKTIAKAVIIYPNPVSAKSNITVELQMLEEEYMGAKIEVFDILGRLVEKYIANSIKSQIMIDATPGTYMVRITTAKNEIFIEKVIVQL